MGRRFGSVSACRGMTDKQVNEKVHKMYADFCRYRYTISGHMPDFRLRIFDKREFDGDVFEIGGRYEKTNS